jgi:WD40 repeat protein
MDHPHIAKVLDAGATDAGRPYFVMELVKGVPITRFCDEHRLTPRQRLELFVRVCQAVQHAHQKGVIHRDLKPSNVLVAEYDDQPTPKVIDFGVAKATGPKLTDRTMFTEFGQVVGTLEYMSPEQAKLNALDTDTRSDIYALGVLLYELLTGTTPFDKKRLQQAAFDEVLRIIREEEPPRPSTRLSTTEGLPSIAASRGLEPKKLSGLVRGELDWVVMKCLEKDRNRRYETANGLAMDLQRYLQDEPVRACPPSAWYRFGKFARRYKASLAAAGLVAGLLALAVLILAVSNYKVNDALAKQTEALQQKKQAYDDLGAAKQETENANVELSKTLTALKREQNKTLEALDQERRSLYSYRIALAAREWEAGRVGRAEAILDDCLPVLRGWEWRYLKRQCHLDLLRLSGHEGTVQAATFVGDGDLVGSCASANNVWRVRLWDAVNGREKLRFTASGSSRFACFSADGRWFAEASGGNVSLYELSSGKEIRRIETGLKAVLLPLFSPDGARLAITGGGGAGSVGDTQVWTIATGEKVVQAPSVNVLTFTADGKSLIVSRPAELAVISATTGAVSKKWPCATGPILAACLGDRLATWDFGGDLKLWQWREGRLLWKRQTGLGAATILPSRLAFHPSGAFLACPDGAGMIRIWNTATGDEWLTIRGHTGRVTSLEFRRDGNQLVSAGEDRTVRIWDTSGIGDRVPPGTRLFRLEGPERALPANSISLSSDGTRLAAAWAPHTVAVWDVASGERKLFRRISSAQGLQRVVLSPDGQRFAFTAETPSTVTIHRCDSGRQVAACSGRCGQILDMAYSHDGQSLATIAIDGTFRLWDPATGTQTKSLGDRLGRPFALSPDSSRLLVVEHAGVRTPDVCLWEIARGKPTWKTRLTDDVVHSMAFDAKGERVAVGTSKRAVILLDAQTGATIRTIEGLAGVPRNVAFHPDGTRLAVATEQGALVLLDATTGREAFAFPGRPTPMAQALFSRDGHWLVQSTSDGAVAILDATPLPQ